MISDVPDRCGATGDQHDPHTLFRLLLGVDLQLLARRYSPEDPDGEATATTYIEAFDGDGSFLITLALVHDDDTIPDGVIHAAIETARHLYSKHARSK
jgi:hypothetical protein